ncbi:MAG: hypothetical protein Q8O30_12955 [Candidatus Omnitrophota bacterium]|nr:hypothetical protein [Candidatus Omnitrophota bacterium]
MEIKLINTQKVLSPTQISIADYVINPYRGCEISCLYCYSLENKNLQPKADSCVSDRWAILAEKNGNFPNVLGIKINAPQVLERELHYKNPKRVLLGSTTECFQYAELKYRLMEKILKILNNYNIAYTILTKSHIIAQYLPLIAQNKGNKIYFTFNCTSDAIIRMFEKKSPSLEERIRTISQIITHNINLRIHIGPFIPYLSSLKDIMAMLPRGIKEIDVELYHQTMGNFKKILKRVDEGFGKDLKNKLADVYLNEKNYLRFASSLREEIEKIKNNNNIKFFYITPDFNYFYSSSIDYEKSC